MINDKTITGRFKSGPEMQELNPLFQKLRESFCRSEDITSMAIADFKNQMLGIDYSSGRDETVALKALYKDGLIIMDELPYVDFDENWNEPLYTYPKTQKAAYDFQNRTRHDPMDTPVSSAPKLTKVQRAKLQAKRKLNRQNRKKARK